MVVFFSASLVAQKNQFTRGFVAGAFYGAGHDSLAQVEVNRQIEWREKWYGKENILPFQNPILAANTALAEAAAQQDTTPVTKDDEVELPAGTATTDRPADYDADGERLGDYGGARPVVIVETEAGKNVTMTSRVTDLGDTIRVEVTATAEPAPTTPATDDRDSTAAPEKKNRNLSVAGFASYAPLGGWIDHYDSDDLAPDASFSVGLRVEKRWPIEKSRFGFVGTADIAGTVADYRGKGVEPFFLTSSGKAGIEFNTGYFAGLRFSPRLEIGGRYGNLWPDNQSSGAALEWDISFNAHSKNGDWHVFFEYGKSSENFSFIKNAPDKGGEVFANGTPRGGANDDGDWELSGDNLFFGIAYKGLFLGGRHLELDFGPDKGFDSGLELMVGYRKNF